MGEKKEIRINGILEAAINEFVEKGYKDASMESIAKRAGLSKGGLYHHFGSKVEILYEVNIQIMEPVAELMVQIEKDSSLVNGINRFISNYLDYWNNNKKLLKLFFVTLNEALNNDKIIESYRESSIQNFDYFEYLFSKGEKESIFKSGDNRSRAIALLSCLDGYLGYLIMAPALPLEEIKKEIQEIFINAHIK